MRARRSSRTTRPTRCAPCTHLLELGQGAATAVQRAEGRKLRGRARFIAGRFAEAASDFAALAKAGADTPHTEIWRFFARLRGGEANIAPPEAAPKDWPRPILDYLRAAIAAQALLRAAGDDPARACEARFALAQSALVEGQLPQAVRHFQAVLATGMTSYSEYVDARAELKRLGF